MAINTQPSAFLPILLLSLLAFSTVSNAKLNPNYYKTTCPKLEQIVQDTMMQKQINHPTTAAAAVRLFFHDCFVQGCDASVLISSTAFFTAERDADINLSLPGDAFDAVVRAKTALELVCPGIVSCADILALATRNLITMVGGPFYNVRLGRKDGFVSKATLVDGNLPLVNMTVSQNINLFARKGFTVEEMVALTGAHTIGFSHCKEFSNRLYNYSPNQKVDPSMNPRYAEALRKACENYQTNPTISAFNDIMSPNKFDNQYYSNLPKGLGLLKTDQDLYADARTRGFVQLYASNQTAFFEVFVHAMEKMSELGVKTGRRGEVRRRCEVFNNLTSKNN